MRYRREIDGLRALAVIPVILFHAGVSSLFEGGFVGVDVFFVISGYLITTILIVDFENGSYSVARFYERRARRILPALYFVVMIACPFAYFWMPPSLLEDFGASVAASMLAISNFFFMSQVDYFSSRAELQPLLHTWSLAVEEQYYFLFPLVLLASRRLSLRGKAIVVAALTALSFGIAEVGTDTNPDRNFFFTFSRFWEIGVGSLCAFYCLRSDERQNEVFSLAGLALIIASVFLFNNATPFPGVYSLAPVFGTALIICFGGGDTLTSRILSHRALVGLGLISYSAYLWHQPLFAFARLRSPTDPGTALMLFLSAASLVLAWVTWKYVEQPFRTTGALGGMSRRLTFGLSGVFGGLLVCAGCAFYFSNGFEDRSRAGKSFGALDVRLAANQGLNSKCARSFTESESCATSQSPDVLLWGDSFAMHLAQGIVASEENAAMRQHTLSSCSPILGLSHFGGVRTASDAQECIEFNRSVLEWLVSNQSVETVVLSSPFGGVLNNSILYEDGSVGTSVTLEEMAENLRGTAETIRSTGAKVIVVSPTPASGWDIGLCSLRSAYFGTNAAKCDFALNSDTAPYKMLKTVEDTVPIYWLHDDICADGVCEAAQDDVFIYRDSGHLSKEGSAFLGTRNNWAERFSAQAE
ncbi:MAG: acyltransferase family protein [Shimia sp.]|uniref:acyltransferase family protein n=1 Tax=Shimia sp. TaxID=1954381 RepID=UPI0040583F40